MENTFLRYRKQLLRQAHPQLLNMLKKIKCNWILISQMYKSYRIVNYWILLLTFALFELQHWLVWILQLLLFFQSSCHESIYLIWILKTATLLVSKSLSYVHFFLFKKGTNFYKVVITTNIALEDLKLQINVFHQPQVLSRSPN